MEFEEILRHDKLSAYTEFNSIHNAFDMHMIPEHYRSILPERCKCGSEFIISRNLKTIRCCNPNCYLKMAYAMSHMFANFECPNLGPETCKQIVSYLLKRDFFQVPSHMEIIGLTSENMHQLDVELGAKWEYLVRAIYKIRHTRMTFGKMVSMVCIPEFGSNSEGLFNDIRSVADFINIHKTVGLVEYLNSRGIKSGTRMTPLIRNLGALTIFEYNLAYPLLSPGLRTKKVCITRSVTVDGVPMSRSKFLEYLNNNLGIVNNIKVFTFIETNGPETVDHIICDQPTNTRKYLAGKAREAAGEKNVILTAQQYVDLIREEVRTLCTLKKETT